MSNLRCGIDIDGCLADFNVGYKALIEREHPSIKLPDISDYYPDTWNYDKAAGLLSADVSRLWNLIKEDKRFWLDLPPYPDARRFLVNLQELENDGMDVYFITSRVGPTSKAQTERWLDLFEFEDPTVLISSEKGMCCKALNLDFYLDDKNENVQDVVSTSPNTQTFMLKRPWNTQQDFVPVLNSLREFLEHLA